MVENSPPRPDLPEAGVAAEPRSALFPSFWMAGFECSTQRRRDGVRLDLLRATRHDRFAREDYRRCREFGFGAVRDGLRWHRIDAGGGRYDWSSWLPMLDAAAEAGVDVVWDLFHWGVPDWTSLADPDFADHFAAYAAAAAALHLERTGRPLHAVPLNEVSFFTWAVDVGYLPHSLDERAPGWAKRQLVRAAVAADTAIRAVSPDRRFLWAEPLIHCAPRHHGRDEVQSAARRNATQFEAIDLLMGLAEPELGGHPDLVDAVGVNFYPHNEWFFEGPTIPLGHHEYRPLADLLDDVWTRYRKPLFIAETGAEGSARAAWLHYVCAEVRTAIAAGIPVAAICLYPVTDYPGWDNGRLCPVGLWGEADAQGERALDHAFAEEIRRQQALFAQPPVPAPAAPPLVFA